MVAWNLLCWMQMPGVGPQGLPERKPVAGSAFPRMRAENERQLSMNMKSNTIVGPFLGLMISLGAATEVSAVLVDVWAQANSIMGGTPLTTIHLNQGQIFTVTTDPNDLWKAGNPLRWSNADGLTKDIFATGWDDSGATSGTQIGKNYGLYTLNGLAAPFGMLVGRIGTTYFRLGSSFAGPAPATGWLELMYWDSNSIDNTDKITVAVHTPEASTLLAGACLLIPFCRSAFQTLRQRRSL